MDKNEKTNRKEKTNKKKEKFLYLVSESLNSSFSSVNLITSFLVA
jgi:hypothetical protein